MAGHRRIPGAAAGQAAVKSKVAVARAGRIRAEARRRYADAQDPQQRFAVAVDYVRSAAAAASRAGIASVNRVLTDATRELMARGDKLTDDLAEWGRGR